MIKINYMSTLFVGIDVSSKSNAVYAMDAFLIADFVRVGRTKKCEPWCGVQYLALKRLTRHRLHLAQCITREKTYMVSNLYLKFSELQLLESEEQPFSNTYGLQPRQYLLSLCLLRKSLIHLKRNCLSFWQRRAETVSQIYLKPLTC